ncbi:MAG: hypothetical protein ACT4NU_06330 [Chromatiales bacterium]
MNWGIIGITFAYLVLAVLLAGLIFRTRWGWYVKTVFVVLVALFCYATFQSYAPLIGWPTSVGLPHRFNLVGVTVDEPNKTTQAKGRIYLWVTDMEQQLGRHVPRAYVLPHTPLLHTKVTDAGKKLRKNLPQLGEVEVARNRTTGAKEVNIQFFDMPDPLFPEK